MKLKLSKKKIQTEKEEEENIPWCILIMFEQTKVRERRRGVEVGNGDVTAQESSKSLKEKRLLPTKGFMEYCTCDLWVWVTIFVIPFFFGYLECLTLLFFLQ